MHPYRSAPRRQTVRLVVEATHEEEVDETHDPVRLQELVQGYLNTTSIYAKNDRTGALALVHFKVRLAE